MQQFKLATGSVIQVPETDFRELREIASKNLDICEQKNREYGSSWVKRGGTGAYHQALARKIDRIEQQAANRGYDILDVTLDEAGAEDLEDTMLDLSNYLLLIVEKRRAIRGALRVHNTADVDAHPTSSYVDQG